ncbi:MAG: acyltransferase family protein [Candidatus Omnitrophota bacterium]
MQPKNVVLDIVKGMAILLVVAGHVIQRSMVVEGQDYFLNPLFKCIYMFHMPVFFFISGFLMAQSLKKRSLAEILKLRAGGLLVPFLSWGLLGMGTVFVLSGGHLNGRGIVDFFMDPAQLPVWFIWFLWTLFVSSFLLLVSVFLERWLGKFSFVAVFLVLLAMPLNSFLSFYYVKWFYLFYLAGYIVSVHGESWVRALNNRVVFVAVVLAFAFLALHWTFNDYIYINQMRVGFTDGQEVLRIIYRYAAGFLGIAVLFFMARYLSGKAAGRLLALLGVYSLDIYLVQRYLVEGVYPKILSWVPLRSDFNGPFFLAVVVPVLTVLLAMACLFLSRFLIRRNIWLNKLLLGNRV